MGFKLKSKGDYSKTTKYLSCLKKAEFKRVLEMYARQGVNALSEATPIRTGETAYSWDYKIIDKNGRIELRFINTHINKGVPIAIILQYGHGTGTGGWVEGRDYINPAAQPFFDDVVDRLCQEVTKL